MQNVKKQEMHSCTQHAFRDLPNIIEIILSMWELGTLKLYPKKLIQGK